MISFISGQLLIAAPSDKIVTYDKYEVFFCGVKSHDTKLTPIRSGPGLLDYCKNIKLNVKHYSSQDNNLRFQCASKSVYRIISEIGSIDDKGICLAKEIKWYCDPVNKVEPLTLPINTYYCPGTLPKNYLNTNILVCPTTQHLQDNIKLLSGGMASDRFFCDNVPLDVVHYVAEDQIIAKYTKLELDRINKEQGWGQLYIDCPSRSAYRILTYKSEPDAAGKCQVTYDVYCDGQTYLKSPFESRQCPRWTVKQVEEPKQEVWRTEYKEVIREAPPQVNYQAPSTCNPQPCGAPCGQIPLCGGGQCGQQLDAQQPCNQPNQPCGGYQMLPYTGYYMMQCQPGQDCSGNSVNNNTIID